MTTYQMAAKYSTISSPVMRLAVRAEAPKPSAEERALARAQAEGTQAYQVGPSAWVATSTSRPGAVYTLTVKAGQVACTCQGAERGLVCKHAALVRTRLAEQHRQAAQDVADLFPD